MNRVDFIDAVAKQTGIDKKSVTAVVAAYPEVITKALKSGDSVAFIGFGTFKTVKKNARKCRNPKTGETIKVPAKTVAKFTPGKALSDAVNKKSAAKKKK